jgi:CRP-like cAMP-binding protein
MVEINLFRNSRDKRSLDTGEVLFVEGEPGEHMFAVVEGELQLTFGGTHVETIGPGGVVGELALIDAAPRSASARATVPTVVAVVDKAHFTFLVQEHPTFALMVMAVMAERLRRQTRHLAD